MLGLFTVCERCCVRAVRCSCLLFANGFCNKTKQLEDNCSIRTLRVRAQRSTTCPCRSKLKHLTIGSLSSSPQRSRGRMSWPLKSKSVATHEQGIYARPSQMQHFLSVSSRHLEFRSIPVPSPKMDMFRRWSKTPSLTPRHHSHLISNEQNLSVENR
jgi:hypothetical protein